MGNIERKQEPKGLSLTLAIEIEQKNDLKLKNIMFKSFIGAKYLVLWNCIRLENMGCTIARIFLIQEPYQGDRKKK